MSYRTLRRWLTTSHGKPDRDTSVEAVAIQLFIDHTEDFSEGETLLSQETARRLWNGMRIVDRETFQKRADRLCAIMKGEEL